MTSWTPLENALHAFGVAASGLAAGRVTWGEQNGPAPAADGSPAITLTLGDGDLKGIDQLPENVNVTDQTVELTSVATREHVLTWRAYSPNATGDLTAKAILEQLQIRCSWEDLRDALSDVGIGILDEGDVQALPRVVNARWESQAILEWRICVLQTASQTVPYIAHVNGSGTVANPGGTPVTVPIDVDLP